MAIAKVRCFTLGAFQVNAYLLEDSASGICAVVDTGDDSQLANALADMQPRPDLASHFVDPRAFRPCRRFG